MTSRNKKLNILFSLERKRSRIIQEMNCLNEYAIGSVSKVTRKCGKKNCRCATGDGHIQTLFLFKGSNGKRICKLIRREDEDRMLSAGENYRRYKDNERELKDINDKIVEILYQIMEEQAVVYE